MGQACSKSTKAEDPASDASAGGSAQNGGAAVTEKNADNFRDRRLSVSQVRDPNAKGAARSRRLSVYDHDSDASGPRETRAPMSTCGCKSIAGVEPVPGGSTAKINQDRGLAIYPYHGEASGLFGVFDGHGRIGEQVSQYVIDTLPQALADNPSFATDPSKALEEAFVSVDTTLAQHVDAGVSGTTAVAALIRGNHMWIANAGDSRAIIARQRDGKGKSGAFKAIDLTIDQKPDTPEEMKRILQMGGHVTPAGANGSPSRVWHNLRGLAMARSIGDHNAAAVGVIAKPEVSQYEITDDDVALIIASDGVWELLSSQTVVDLVATIKDLDPEKICDKIVDQASYMWKVEEGDYRDDISVVVLTFPWLDSYEADSGEKSQADE